jgi:NADPH2:quinone reductase
MSHAIRIHEHGGPEVLRWEEVPDRAPGEGEVRIRQTAVGLNFIDVYHRTGLYPVPDLPAPLGREAAGTVEAVGPGVDGFEPGDRVAYPMHAGAYAEVRVVPAAALVRLPDTIDDRTAAAVMLKGLTAWYLLRRTYRVRAGETVLVHAAAGGVGLIACQWARHVGATVLGTVGSAEKADLAREHGCHVPILYREEDVVARVREHTGGRGVPVVYDSVGRDTWTASLDCLAPRGLMVSFGQSSGSPPPLDLQELSRRGSLYVTRPTLATFLADGDEYRAGAAELFDVLASGAVRVRIGATYRLAEAARAHRDLESRRTTGSTVLLP